MALWGISTTTETAANNYAIPKYQHSVDRNRSPWNTFADVRGWIQRWYGTTENSGLSTNYYDEVLVPVAGLNTGPAAGISSNATGLCIATPVAVFFEDPNKASPITVGGGGTTGVTTGRTAYVHVVWNETVYAGAGSTVRIRTFDANGANETTSIIGYAASVAPGAYVPVYTNTNGQEVVRNFDGQITNRVAFAFTSPNTVLTANVPFLNTTVNAPISAGSTNIFVASTAGVVAGVSSVTVDGVSITNRPIVAVGSTFIQIGTGSTVNNVIGIGTVVTFTTRTSKSKLVLDLTAGVVGTITDFSGGAAVTKSLTGLLYNVGGAGTTGSVGLGTDMLDVTA
jgi:hypothetical protein